MSLRSCDAPPWPSPSGKHSAALSVDAAEPDCLLIWFSACLSEISSRRSLQSLAMLPNCAVVWPLGFVGGLSWRTTANALAMTACTASWPIATASPLASAAAVVCDCGKHAFKLNERAWGRLCAQPIDATLPVKFSRDRQELFADWHFSSLEPELAN